MLNKGQEQKATDGSTAVQAGRDVIINGLSYSEVREVALDVFKANFYELIGVAKETASARAEEITESFLSKLQKENPAGFTKSSDPDFQYALFTVQKEYARNGDKDLGDLLVDLLVDRSKEEQRDILQIVLNESLHTAPKLTENQLAVLAVIFFFRYTQTFNIYNHETVFAYIDKHIKPFISKIVKNLSCYQHLEFSGTATIGIGEMQLEQILKHSHHGYFLKGFEIEEIIKRGISIGEDPRFFMPCLNDASKLQVRADNQHYLDKTFEQHNIVAEDRKKITELFNFGLMTDSEIKEKCIEIRPYMANVFETWSGSAMKNISLTSVGIAIGHANIKRLAGEFSNLSMWIN